MKKLLSFAVVAIVAFAAGWYCNDYHYDDVYNYNKLEAYQRYYVHVEALLDTLNDYDDWVDRFDPQEYYQSVSELDSINKGLK